MFKSRAALLSQKYCVPLGSTTKWPFGFTLAILIKIDFHQNKQFLFYYSYLLHTICGICVSDQPIFVEQKLIKFVHIIWRSAFRRLRLWKSRFCNVVWVAPENRILQFMRLAKRWFHHSLITTERDCSCSSLENHHWIHKTKCRKL